MTPKGHLVMGIVSLIVVIGLMIRSVLKMEKGGEGWELAVLIPVLIFVANTI